MNDLIEKVFKFQWVCAIIVIAFSIECYYEKEIMREFIMTFEPNVLRLIMINRVLTGVTAVSFLVTSVRKTISEYQHNDSLAIIDIINYSLTGSVFIWVILLKSTFTMIVWTISDIPITDSAISGWHNLYWCVIIISTILWIIVIIKKNRESVSP